MLEVESKKKLIFNVLLFFSPIIITLVAVAIQLIMGFVNLQPAWRIRQDLGTLLLMVFLPVSIPVIASIIFYVIAIKKQLKWAAKTFLWTFALLGILALLFLAASFLSCWWTWSRSSIGVIIPITTFVCFFLGLFILIKFIQDKNIMKILEV